MGCKARKTNKQIYIPFIEKLIVAIPIKEYSVDYFTQNFIIVFKVLCILTLS